MPPKYDLSISTLFNIIIWFGLIWHYAFAIWIYGNPQILQDNSQSALDSIATYIKNLFSVSVDSFSYEVITRMTLPHNILCLLYMIFLVVFIFIKLSLIELIELCYYQKIKKQIKKINVEEKNLEIGLGKI